MDTNRAWCPKPGCNTICHICASATNLTTKASARSVNCPKCEKEFCSSCSGNWHPGMTCQDYGKMLVKNHNEQDTLLMIEGDIKRCPMCQVPIERDAGCAQMMCKRCKHVFCWFCLTSLDVSTACLSMSRSKKRPFPFRKSFQNEVSKSVPLHFKANETNP